MEKTTSPNVVRSRGRRLAVALAFLFPIGVIGGAYSVWKEARFHNAVTQYDFAELGLAQAEGAEEIADAMPAGIERFYDAKYGDGYGKGFVTNYLYGGTHLDVSGREIVDICIDGLSATTEAGHFVPSLRAEAACDELGEAQTAFNQAGDNMDELMPTDLDLGIVIASVGLISVGGVAGATLMRQSNNE